ncbi:MAG: leucine-rich repeat protein [Clostridia bacterium]|nr:leucine-rich repeat protein [Clostridia bacterium]
MNWKKTVALGLSLLFLCFSATACQKEKENSADTDTEEVETEGPISPEQQTDYTDDAEKLAYIQAFGETFTGMAETDAEHFTFTETDGKLTVTGYTGTASEVRVPAVIGGNPVVAVGDGAFAQNGVLTKLYLPDSIIAVGEGILTDADALRALRTPILGSADAQFLGYLFGATKYEDNPVNVPASLAYLELGGSMKSLPDCALFDCNDLICVTLSDSITTLGNYSMFQCSSLLALNVGGLTSVGEYALGSCTSLTRLEFGTGLTSIGLGALEGCMNLRTLVLPFVGASQTENTYLGYIFGAVVPDFSAGFYPTYLVEVKLLSPCTSLGDYAFYECDSLLRVELPTGMTSIGVRAFSYCTRLESVKFSDSVTTISENAFFGCRKLQSVTFGANSALSSIGINAFYGCKALTSIALPQSLTALPASCFADCASLATVDLGGVTSVGKNAFHNCLALTSLSVSPNVTFADGNEYAESLLQE